MKKVALVGCGQTKYQRKNRANSVQELIFEATQKALEDAGLEKKDIDTVIVGSCDTIDGISISNAYSVDVTAAFLKDESKVEEDAAFAAYYAILRILSGSFDTALIVGWGKNSEVDIHLATNMIFEPFYSRPFGLDAIQAFALQARMFLDKNNLSEEEAARVIVKNRKNALKNPYLEKRKEINLEDVLKSEYISTPLKKLDFSPVTDGAVAVILSEEKTAKKITKRPVWFSGLGLCSDTYHLGYRDLTELPATKIAAENACRMAGIKNILNEIDLAEIYEVFSFGELILYEALGICSHEQISEFINKGQTEIGGKFPVNPSGGSLNANPLPATGLIRLAEAYLQLSGKAGERQIENASSALVYATSGLCFQSNMVYILNS